MSQETNHQWREELGAYLLGTLEPADAEQMRAHLEWCQACRAEYAELAPVAGLLAKVPAEAFFETARDPAAMPDPAMWDRLRSRAALVGGVGPAGDPRLRANPSLPSGQRPGGTVRPPQPNPSSRPSSRRARRSMRPSTAALMSGVLVAAAAVGIYAGTRSSSGLPAGTETVTAQNAADGVTGTVQYHAADWGSWVQITLKGVKPGDDCVLYAMDKDGNKAVASSWWAPDAISQSATIPGGVAMDVSDIKKFQVATTAGEVLLTVPVT
ncbi:MAG TPA: zf-HC2 domain-containing protein [Actinospica sp.]|nr:zf-HC2 domain-containing protein [Actinospica sp.]